MANRFAKAIIRIVEPLIDEVKTTDPLLDKPPIEGKRGIGYIGASGAAIGAVGAAGSTIRPASTTATTAGVSDAAQAALDAANAATSALGSNGSSSGAYDAQDLLNGTGPFGTNTVDDLLSGAVNGAGGVLMEITGLRDAASGGAAFNVRLDGNYTPPIGWDDANTPPVDPTYIAGSYWTLISGVTGYYAQSGGALLDLRASIDGTQAYEISGGLVVNTSPSGGEALIQFGAPGHNVGDSAGSVGGTQYAYSGAGSIGFGDYGPESCSAPDPGAVTICGMSAPLATHWPNTSTSQLTLSKVLSDGNGGNFTFNPYDRSLPTALKNNSSTITGFTSTGTPIQLTKLKNGGLAYYQTLGGNPTGVVQLYNSNGTFMGTTSASGLTLLLP